MQGAAHEPRADDGPVVDAGALDVDRREVAGARADAEDGGGPGLGLQADDGVGRAGDAARGARGEEALGVQAEEVRAVHRSHTPSAAAVADIMLLPVGRRQGVAPPAAQLCDGRAPSMRGQLAGDTHPCQWFAAFMGIKASGCCEMGEPMIQAVDPELIAAAVQSLAEGIVLVDADGRIVYVNRAFAVGLGLPAEQVVGRRWDDPALRVTDLEGRPIPPEKRAFRQVLATGKPVLNYDYIVYHVSGRPVRVLLNAVPVHGPDGLAGVAVTMTDITERTAAEDALRENEAMLRAFVDQSRYGFFISSVEGEVVLYNHAMETLTGFPAEEVKAKGWLEAAFPDPAERARAAEQARKQFTGEAPYIEEVYTRKDGSKTWVSSAVSPVRLHDRDYISGILIDITDRVKAEDKVRFQASLLDQVRNAVIGSDAERRIIYVNESAERLFGWDAGGGPRPRRAGVRPDPARRIRATGRRRRRWSARAAGRARRRSAAATAPRCRSCSRSAS